MEHLVVGDRWSLGFLDLPENISAHCQNEMLVTDGDCTEWWPTNSILKCYSSYIRIKWWSPKTTTEDLKEHHPRNPKISKTTPQPRNRIFKKSTRLQCTPHKVWKISALHNKWCFGRLQRSFPLWRDFHNFLGGYVSSKPLWPSIILIAS